MVSIGFASFRHENNTDTLSVCDALLSNKQILRPLKHGTTARKDNYGLTENKYANGSRGWWKDRLCDEFDEVHGGMFNFKYLLVQFLPQSNSWEFIFLSA